MSFTRAISKSAEMYVCYKLLELIGRRYVEFDAYRLGLIDERGNTIRKAKTKEEKDAMSYIVVLALNFKKTAVFNPLFYSKLKINPLLAMQESIDLEEMISGDAGGDSSKEASGENSGPIVHVTSKDNVPDAKKKRKSNEPEVHGADEDEKDVTDMS